jgi:glycosyltransferase involved in cell wall biosynthesis
MEIIHIVLGKANPDRMNGVNKVVYQLATKQVEFGENVAVWGIAKDKDNNYGERNFETRLFIKKTNPFGIPSEIEAAIIEKKNKAIFHIHGGWVPVFSSIGKLLHKYEIPFVFTPHGAYNTIAMNRSFWSKRIYFSLFEKKLLQNATKIHCIGKSEMVGLKCIFENDKSILVPYGFENNAEVTLENSKNETIVFGFIGRLDIYTKGLDTMIIAFKKLLKKHPNTQLWIVGDSKEKAKLDQMIIENDLSKNVTLFGGKFGVEKDNLLKQMDVFVHPSRNEGLPTSVIEAASYGKPCIVTDATNIGDLITEYQCGETIYNQDSKELCKSMTKFAMIWNNQYDFTEIRQNAVRMVKENFNWKKVIQEFNTKLYNA